jgi:serine protease inhibitor
MFPGSQKLQRAGTLQNAAAIITVSSRRRKNLAQAARSKNNALMKILLPVMFLVLATRLMSASLDPATQAINAFGLDLHRQQPKTGNLCLSPYSIQSALAMTYMGASGVTQQEMAKVLHFPDSKADLGESFAALAESLSKAQKKSNEVVTQAKKHGGPGEALSIHVANRLYGLKSYEFRKRFLADVKNYFDAPLETMNFIKDTPGATREINRWVAKQTRDRIRDLIPNGGLTADTRLVLVNALYMKASWENDFSEGATRPEPFRVNGRETVAVPMMLQQEYMGYFDGRGFQAVTLPYAGGDLHFLLIVPNKVDGVAHVEAVLTPEMLATCAKAKSREVILHLPKFKITPLSVNLGVSLQKLGMTTAFDSPAGSADFDAMAPKKPTDYLRISSVFHQTFLALDEKGTEAAAATAVAVPGSVGIVPEREKPVELRVDRPFLFAIQHAGSGACLFLGRVTDPR